VTDRTKEEFVSLISEYQGIIHKVCHMYQEDEEDRRDLFQLITFQLWKAYPKFRGDAKFTTWMYRIALNTAITNYRKDRRKPVNVMYDEQTLQIPYEERNDLERNEQIVMLRKAIDLLSDVEKAIITLYLEERGYPEIAEIVGITQNNVRVKMNRIKKKLRKVLTGVLHGA
jgi:RNA polymerase sigma-70 factor, ECF subfamily